MLVYLRVISTGALMVAVAMNGAAVRTDVNLIGKNLEITTVTGRYRSGRFDIKPAFLIGGRLIGASLIVVRYELLEWPIHLVAYFFTRSGNNSNTLLCSEM